MGQLVARVLLIADTHLGFDLPARPRVARRRRGPDFFANYERALAPAMRGRVDLVIHGGDLLYRSKVSAGLVHQALEPLLAVAERGTPVCLVPGNHERSRIPYPLLSQHPNLHIFDRPRTVTLELACGLACAVAGFPFVREIGRHFRQLVKATGYRDAGAKIRLLCMHQAVEGAQVGARDFTFRGGLDVVRGRDVPGDIAALLSGHIHRAQTLHRDLRGWPLGSPVVYPGSVERTSFQERHEVKGFSLLELRSGRNGGSLVRNDFVPLPTRPMAIVDLDGPGAATDNLLHRLQRQLSQLDANAVVRVRVRGRNAAALRSSDLRRLAPASMTLSLQVV